MYLYIYIYIAGLLSLLSRPRVLTSAKVGHIDIDIDIDIYICIYVYVDTYIHAYLYNRVKG